METILKTLVDIIEEIKGIVGNLFSGVSIDIKLRKSETFIVLDDQWILNDSTQVPFEKLIELNGILKLNYKLKIGSIVSDKGLLYLELINDESNNE